jgi:hypothetical protein
LHDDLDDVTLDAALITAPPLDLWPNVIKRVELPKDVEVALVKPLQAERGNAHGA